jgi:hypothetical protein
MMVVSLWHPLALHRPVAHGRSIHHIVFPLRSALLLILLGGGVLLYVSLVAVVQQKLV